MKTSSYRSLLFGSGILALVLLLTLSAPAFGESHVRINDYVIDVKGQEPVVPPELEPGNL